MASPIVLLSGCVGFGEEYTRVEGYSNADVGAVCLKGTTVLIWLKTSKKYNRIVRQFSYQDILHLILLQSLCNTALWPI